MGNFPGFVNGTKVPTLVCLCVEREFVLSRVKVGHLLHNLYIIMNIS